MIWDTVVLKMDLQFIGSTYWNILQYKRYNILLISNIFIKLTTIQTPLLQRSPSNTCDRASDNCSFTDWCKAGELITLIKSKQGSNNKQSFFTQCAHKWEIREDIQNTCVLLNKAYYLCRFSPLRLGSAS
jgi:hypothetical protein